MARLQAQHRDPRYQVVRVRMRAPLPGLEVDLAARTHRICITNPPLLLPRAQI